MSEASNTAYSLNIRNFDREVASKMRVKALERQTTLRCVVEEACKNWLGTPEEKRGGRRQGKTEAIRKVVTEAIESGETVTIARNDLLKGREVDPEPIFTETTAQLAEKIRKEVGLTFDGGTNPIPSPFTKVGSPYGEGCEHRFSEPCDECRKLRQ